MNGLLKPDLSIPFCALLHTLEPSRAILAKRTRRACLF